MVSEDGRRARASLTVWEVATSRNLVCNLDLLHDVLQGRFRPDGRLDITSSVIGTLDLPLDAWPAAQIVDDIRCRVSLAVGPSGQLTPVEPTCPR